MNKYKLMKLLGLNMKKQLIKKANNILYECDFFINFYAIKNNLSSENIFKIMLKTKNNHFSNSYEICEHHRKISEFINTKIIKACSNINMYDLILEILNGYKLDFSNLKYSDINYEYDLTYLIIKNYYIKTLTFKKFKEYLLVV